MDNSIINTTVQLPINLPLLPIEGPPLFPGMVTQMIVTQKTIIDFIDFLDKYENKQSYLGLLMMKDTTIDNPFNFDNLYKIGTVAKLHKKINLPDGGYSVFLSLLERFTVESIVRYSPPLIAKVNYNFLDTYKKKKDPELTALTRSLITEMKSILSNNPIFSEDVRLNMVNIDHPGQIADFISSILNLKREEQQEILETFNLHDRIIKVLTYLNREKSLIKIQKKIQSQINDNVEKHRREHFLKEMLKEIKTELGEPPDGKVEDVKSFKQRLENLPIDEDTKQQITKEIERFELLETYNPEHSVLLGYLEKVMSLPWEDPKPININLDYTQKLLDKQHFGMEKIKERIIEHLAVKKIKGSDAKSILCLVGPPGVGKTSIARSIAEAIKKKLFHFSVGGMRDEAEIKGHRRTYIGAMPGKIIQGLLNVKEKDPVFVIDEIDKLARGAQGDPSSALLEVLDPVQNTHFRDLYIDIPFDLSKIFFITTANSTQTIPKPLLDRMEVIELFGYIDSEKLAIAQKYIIPKSLITHGLKTNQIKFTNNALKSISEHYAREAGMRIFEQCINKIIRKISTKFIMFQETTQPNKKNSKKQNQFWPVIINELDIEKYLGLAPFKENVEKRASTPGTSIGLAWTNAGGDVLIIESQSIKNKSNLILTGTLGDVMKESARIALTVSKNYFESLNLKTKNYNAEFFNLNEIHLHVPEGATPKDGPSAGITMSVSLLSLALQITMKPNFAMTGELSLTKQVLPIGGLREKIVAARRNNIKNIIIPKANITDIYDIPDYITHKLNIYPVSKIEEVFSLLFPKLNIDLKVEKLDLTSLKIKNNSKSKTILESKKKSSNSNNIKNNSKNKNIGSHT